MSVLYQGDELSGLRIVDHERDAAPVLFSCSKGGEITIIDLENCDTNEGKHDIPDTDNDIKIYCNTRGSPADICFDNEQRNAYVADLAHAAILHVDDMGNTQIMVKDYEGFPLLGPSSITTAPDGSVIFTDSGPLGETTIDQPLGSVYIITRDENGQMLKPLLHKCLAHPSGVAVAENGDIFVAEMLKNRILRLAKSNNFSSVYHCSVYHQFSGRFGPSALAVNEATSQLYVARFDFASDLIKKKGLVSVLNLETGEQENDISIPNCGPEITGITVMSSVHETQVFVAEASSGRIVRS